MSTTPIDPKIAAPAAPRASGAGGSDPVTAIANVVGLGLELAGSRLATEYTRDLTKVRLRRVEVKAEIREQKLKRPKWDASKVGDLLNELDDLEAREDALIAAAALEMERARNGK
jgi:hypothetical protein